jgi:hypothetical protein
MMWYWYLSIFLGIYLAIGVVMIFVLLQTPYAENPLWTMLLLWPLYLWNL